MKIRFTLVITLILAVTLLFAGCQSTQEPAAEVTTEAPEETGQETATEAPEETGQESGQEGSIVAPDQQAALISVQERGDHGVVDALVSGFLEGAAAYGYDDARIVVVSDPATYESTVRQVAESGFDLIIATFPPMIDAVQTVAPDFPDTHFVLLDARLEEGQPNVQELFFKEHESSFLAGVAAGMMTETDKVGFIGGVVQDVINRYASGFYQGAHYANSDVTVCWTYTDALQDPAKGKEVALSFFDQDMDIIHAATAGTQLGIYEASKQTENYMISADVDVIPLNPGFGLFATGPKFDEAMKLELREHAAGTWEPGYRQFGLESGLVGLTPFNQTLVPLEVQQSVLDAQQAIIDGEIEVEGDLYLEEVENCS